MNHEVHASAYRYTKGNGFAFGSYWWGCSSFNAGVHEIDKTGKNGSILWGRVIVLLFIKTYFPHKIECPFLILLDNGLITESY